MLILLQWLQIIYRPAVADNDDADREDQPACSQGRAANAFGNMQAVRSESNRHLRSGDRRKTALSTHRSSGRRIAVSVFEAAPTPLRRVFRELQIEVYVPR
jgi:hypothetical protein